MTNEDLLELKEGGEEEEEEEGETRRYRRGKQLSSYHLLDNVSSESEDDSELTALLHQKVILVSATQTLHVYAYVYMYMYT